MRHSNDWMNIVATIVLFTVLGLAGLAMAGLLTGLLLFLAIFAVGLAVVGSVGFAVATVLRLLARRQQPYAAGERLEATGRLVSMHGRKAPQRRRPG